MRRQRPDLTPFVALLVALWLLASWGCSANPRHQYAVASQTVAASLFAIQDAEAAAFKTQRITPAQHQRFNQHLVIALTIGREFNTAVRTWQTGQPAPKQLEALKAALLAMTTEISSGWPEDVKTQLLSTLTATYDAIVAILLARGGA